MLTFIILSSASFSSSSSPTPIFFFFSGDLGRLRLELSLTICALSAFHCFTPGQNTKNDYHCSDTSLPGLACTFEWLLLSSTHCFFYFSSCYLHPMMFQFITSLSFEIITLNQIKLKQPPTVRKYLCFCGWMLDVADPAGRQCERPNETWCLHPDFSPSGCPDGHKKNLLNMVYLHSSDDKPLSPPCLLCPLQYLFQYWYMSTANKVE